MAVLGRPKPNQNYQQLFDRAKRARLPFDREYFLNTLFYRGEQYTDWSDDVQGPTRIAPPANNPKIPRPVFNKIKHFVLQEHAMVLKNRPTSGVMAAGEDPEDISDAQVCDAYLEWLTDENVANFAGTLSIAAMHALSGTEGYLKWTWNTRLGEPDKPGGPAPGRGDVSAPHPLDVYVDPYATEFYQARYIFHSRFMDTEQVYETYGKEVPPTALSKADLTRASLLREMGMAPVLEGAEVTEMWAKPCRRYPSGLLVVWSGNEQLLPPDKFPYDHGQLPFTQIGSIMLPGTPHYESVVGDMRSPSMELNRAHAQGISIRNAFANPKWAVPDECEMETLPDDSPDQVLKYNSNMGQVHPQILQPTTMPNDDHGNWIAAEMMNVVGLHEVSQGQVPGRVEAAKAIELLQETDDGRLAEMVRTIGTSISVGFYQQLMLAKQFAPAEQILATYSREGMPEVKRFKTSAIKPGMKIRVSMDTGLARSKAARADQVMNMWAQGIITDRELVAELLDMPVSTISPNNAYDIRLARNENLTLAGGQPVVPNSWDNHAIHLRELNNYRKTGEFLQKPTDVKTIFEHHADTHEQMLIAALQKQLQIQQMSQAVAAGGGNPLDQTTDPVQASEPPAAGQDGITPQRQATFQNSTASQLNHPPS